MQPLSTFLSFCSAKERLSSAKCADEVDGYGTQASPSGFSVISTVFTEATEQTDLQSFQEALTPYLLESTAQVLADNMEPWGFTKIVPLSRLQEAKRNHGCVELMESLEDGGRMVAVKKMPTWWTQFGPEAFRERHPHSSEKPWVDIGIVKFLNNIGYPYACELLGVFSSDDTMYCMYSLATEGDLFSWCEQEPTVGLAREQAMHPLVSQIFKGVMWLHELGIAHRDLSLENILLTDDCGALNVKLIDFGMATLNRMVENELCSKLPYQAPETHLQQPYDTFLSDVFALGVVLFAMATQDYPWKSTKKSACVFFEYVYMFGLRKLLCNRRDSKNPTQFLIEIFSPDFVNLLDGMLQKDPAQRLALGRVGLEPEEPGNERSADFCCVWCPGGAPAAPSP